MIQERKTCRACGSTDLVLVLDLGKTALANDFLEPSQAGELQPTYPLRAAICTRCSLLQLADTVAPEVLYSRYAYVSSTSRTMDSHLHEQSRHLLATGEFGHGARVLEIASNTGIYLKKFKELGCAVVGVEPAANIAAMAVKEGIPTRNEFFTPATARQIAQEWGQADLIVGRHVFAHIDDLQGLLEGLDQIAHDRTVIAFEVPYLLDFYAETEFDTIYHEHLSYVSVRALEALLAKSPFQLHRVDHYPIHGGAILFQMRRRSAGIGPDASVGEILELEKRLALDRPENWKGFASRVRRIQTELPKLLRELKGQGKRIIGYGASAKGNTLLNTCGITSAELDYIIDNTPFKQEKLAPGSHIPVRPPETLLKDQPDYALLLAWNFSTEIVARESEFQQRGGRFIVPIPRPRVLNQGDKPA